MENKDYVGFYFKKINDFFLANANARLKEKGLTFSQLYILIYLINIPTKSIPQKQIEHYFNIKHPTLIGILKRMEKKGLVRIEVDPHDHRSRLVFPLDKAFELGNEFCEDRKKMDKLITKNLSAKQIEDLKNTLKIIYSSLGTNE